MGYSFGKTLLKVFKNLGVVGALAALQAMSGSVNEVAAELGTYAPLVALGLQMLFSFAVDYIQHKDV